MYTRTMINSNGNGFKFLDRLMIQARTAHKFLNHLHATEIFSLNWRSVKALWNVNPSELQLSSLILARCWLIFNHFDCNTQILKQNKFIVYRLLAYFLYFFLGPIVYFFLLLSPLPWYLHLCFHTLLNKRINLRQNTMNKTISIAVVLKNPCLIESWIK